MATTGMSYFAITACLLLHFASQSIDAVNYHFDDSSCDNLLPVVDAVTPGRQNVPNRESSPQNGQKSLLVASNETAPYTIIAPTYYKPGKLYNAFAVPDLKSCGKLTSCYRYSGTSGACTDKECDFVFVSQVDPEYVAFTVGGKFTETKGYIGVAFTNEKFGKLELFACVKHLNDLFEVKHYVAQDIESQPEEQFQQLQSTAMSFGDNGRHVWCRFRRALQIPKSQLSDFTQPQTMMFLRGPLMQTSRGIVLPQLGKSFVFAENQWNSTAALVDNLVTVDGGSRGEPLMCLTFVSIAVTLFFASGN